MDSLINDLQKALPADLCLEELFAGKKEINSLGIAEVEQILRDCERINWEAYSLCSPDIQDADPVAHFLKTGLYERRTLSSWHRLRKPRIVSSPRLSVIVYNRNLGFFLRRSLSCLLDQSLSDIEIIVADDGSEDGSQEIIREFSEKSDLVKPILFQEPAGRYKCLEAATNKARGDYVLFLDAPDFCEKHACRDIFESIGSGYDCAAFNVEFIRFPGAATGDSEKNHELVNKLPAGVYNRARACRLAFVDRAIPQSLRFKAFLREVIQEAFTSLKDATNTGEPYALLMALNSGRNMLKIPAAPLQSFPAARAGDTDRPLKGERARLEGLCIESGLAHLFPYMEDCLMDLAIRELKNTRQELIGAKIEEMKERFGALPLAVKLMRHFYTEWDELAALLRNNQGVTINEKPRSIGIYYYDISSMGGIQTTISSLCRLLRANGYDVTLFLQVRTETDIAIDDSIPIYYLPEPRHTAGEAQTHLEALHDAVRESQIDVMIYLSGFNKAALWITCLLHFMDIPILYSLRRDHNIDLLRHGRLPKYRGMLDTLACMDKIFTLSVSTELYLKSHGIDAMYLPNPIRSFSKALPPTKTRNNILVIARMSDNIKNVAHCALILAEVKKEITDAHMIFVGDFEREEDRQAFYRHADFLGIASNIEITGWTAHPEIYMDQCKVMLSTAYIEGFPNGIAEAQSRGLPVVMYWLDIAMAVENPGIILVDQGDFKSAADALVSLLQNDKARTELGYSAQATARKFSGDRFIERIIDLINSFSTTSPLSERSLSDYKTALTGLSLYVAKGEPSQLK